MSFDLKTAISSIAPTLATMLGGPLAGTAVGALVNAFGLTPTGDNARDVSAITNVVQSGNMTADIIASIRAADQHHAEVMEQHGIDLLKLNSDHDIAASQILANDLVSARGREVAVKDRTPAVLALFAVVCFVSLVVSVLQGVSPAEGMKDTFLILVGAAIAVFKDVYGYYFGSSSGSRDNQEALRSAAKSKENLS
jgi:hypothetical protein